MPSDKSQYEDCKIKQFDRILKLDSTEELKSLQIAYNTYGTLNKDKSNGVMVCHALTGDQYLIGYNPITKNGGWWELMVGSGKAVDTDKFFVICPNVLGGCAGTTGPSSLNPETARPYGLDFPVITISDMVRAQVMLLDYLGIDRLLTVMGGSMGGMQALCWAAEYPDRVAGCIPIASTWRHSAQNIAFHEVGRQAIMADLAWNKGNYYEKEQRPSAGLAVARMAAHITYMSEKTLTERFGRNLQDREKLSFGFDADFQIESYLRHQGISFVERYDANSYLYITRATDYYDLSAGHGSLSGAFEGTKTRFCVLSFDTDWLYTTQESRTLMRALNASKAHVSFADLSMDKGHDSFLLDCPEMFDMVSGFLSATMKSLDRGGSL